MIFKNKSQYVLVPSFFWERCRSLYSQAIGQLCSCIYRMTWGRLDDTIGLTVWSESPEVAMQSVQPHGGWLIRWSCGRGITWHAEKRTKKGKRNCRTTMTWLWQMWHSSGCSVVTSDNMIRTSFFYVLIWLCLADLNIWAIRNDEQPNVIKKYRLSALETYLVDQLEYHQFIC